MKSALHDLDRSIAFIIADARGNDDALREIAACLIAGIGLTVAVHADGDAALASTLCESATSLIFDAAAEQAENLRIARRPQ